MKGVETEDLLVPSLTIVEPVVEKTENEMELSVLFEAERNMDRTFVLGHSDGVSADQVMEMSHCHDYQ